MERKDILSVAILAGKIMLENGAETYRVEDTIKTIIKNYSYINADAFATPTVIIVSISDESHDVITNIKRIKSITNNLEKIALVNQLSRDISITNKNPKEVYNELKIIENKLPYKTIIKIIASGITCFSFLFMFGGNLLEGFFAFLIGVLSYGIFAVFSRKKKSRVIENLFVGFIIGLMSNLIGLLNIPLNINTIITASIMPYVPGLLLTNAVRDILEGDFLSGTVRVFDAVIVSVSLATGAVVVGSLFNLFY